MNVTKCVESVDIFRSCLEIVVFNGYHVLSLSYVSHSFGLQCFDKEVQGFNDTVSGLQYR